MTKLTRSKTKPKDRIKTLKKRLANAEHSLKKKESNIQSVDKIEEHLEETGSKVAFMPNEGCTLRRCCRWWKKLCHVNRSFTLLPCKSA